MALVLLMAVGAAYDGYSGYPSDSSYQATYDGPGDSRHHDHDNAGDRHHSNFYDWLSPGYTYSYWYPTTYYYGWYPTSTYTYYYPQYYYYTPPVTYRTAYYTPMVYDRVVDPWWAANVYGVGSTTYYYSSGSSWSYRSGFF